MRESFGLEERNPLMPHFFRRELKNPEKLYSDYLKQDFYFRNIQHKKKQLEEGKLSAADFEDDGVLKYEVTEQGR